VESARLDAPYPLVDTPEERGPDQMAHVARALVAVALIALLAPTTAFAGPGRAKEAPDVRVQHVAALAPDGRSMIVQVLASCPERWTVVEASVRVSQPGAFGQAAFPLTCIGSLRSFLITVPVASGTFQLGDAVVSAAVVVERGKTARADDSRTLPVQPLVLVELAGFARLENDNRAVVIDVTVTCHPETTGLESRLVVSQGRTLGVGLYTPICDGTAHTFSVRVEPPEGVYNPAFVAQALTFANTEHAGQVVYGIDDDGSLELVN
jgi:hypothetical protein